MNKQQDLNESQDPDSQDPNTSRAALIPIKVKGGKEGASVVAPRSIHSSAQGEYKSSSAISVDDPNTLSFKQGVGPSNDERSSFRRGSENVSGVRGSFDVDNKQITKRMSKEVSHPGFESTIDSILKNQNSSVVGSGTLIDKVNKRSETSNRKYRAFMNFIKYEKNEKKHPPIKGKHQSDASLGKTSGKPPSEKMEDA